MGLKPEGPAPNPSFEGRCEILGTIAAGARRIMPAKARDLFDGIASFSALLEVACQAARGKRSTRLGADPQPPRGSTKSSISPQDAR